MWIEIGNHPQEHAFSGSGLAGNRNTFAGPKRKIDRAQMKPAQCMAFEHAKQLSFRVVGAILVGNSPDESRPSEPRWNLYHTPRGFPMAEQTIRSFAVPRPIPIALSFVAG